MSDTEQIGAESAREHTLERGHGPTIDRKASRNGQGRRSGGLAGWIESRTGLFSAARDGLNPPMPGGARWSYGLVAALVAGLVIEAVTGILLLFSYSPASTTAWGSVYYIDRQLAGGWFLRGLHHSTAHALVVVAISLLIQMLVSWSVRAPRELTWWLAVGLTLGVLGATLTGNALCWDQDGYWAWSVETGIAGGAPVIGPYLQRLIVGGTDLGTPALGRLFALHVVLVPLGIVFLLRAWRGLWRRLGPMSRPTVETIPAERAWPRQVFYNLAAAFGFFAVIATLVLMRGGVALEAPADPASDYPARPAWFFLWLFQLRKAFPGSREVIATVVVPGVLLGMVLLLPFLERLMPRLAARVIASALFLSILCGAAYLTTMANLADSADRQYRDGLAKAEVARERAFELAGLGIPPEGAQALLSRDPLTRGRAILEAKCLSCHVESGQGHRTRFEAFLSGDHLKFSSGSASVGLDDQRPTRALEVKLPGFTPESVEPVRRGETVVALAYRGTDGSGNPVEAEVSTDGRQITWVVEARQSAADLHGYGSREWIRGLLKKPDSETYFGRVPQCGGMARWRESTELTPAELDAIADFFVEHVSTVPEDLPASEWESSESVYSHPGYEAFHKEGECASCHVTIDWSSPNDEAPNLYGWGSPWYLRRMIRRPGAPHNYGYLDPSEQMPSFAEQLSESDLEALVRYLKQDYPGAVAKSEVGSTE